MSDIALLPALLAVVAPFALLLAFTLADRATGNDPDRRGVCALAVVAGSA